MSVDDLAYRGFVSYPVEVQQPPPNTGPQYDPYAPCGPTVYFTDSHSNEAVLECIPNSHYVAFDEIRTVGIGLTKRTATQWYACRVVRCGPP